jgi:hypothetical protein
VLIVAVVEVDIVMVVEVTKQHKDFQHFLVVVEDVLHLALVL